MTLIGFPTQQSMTFKECLYAQLQAKPVAKSDWFIQVERV